MPVEQNKELVRRQFEYVSAGNAEAAAALWADPSRNHGRLVPRSAMAQVYRSLIALHETHTLHEVIAEGEWVAVRTTCQGRFDATPEGPVNSGIHAGVAPNGREYTNQHIHFFRVEQGLLTEHWANRDDLGVARQIGLGLVPKG